MIRISDLPPQLRLGSPTSLSADKLLARMRPGQLLQAVVLSGNEGGSVKLRIGAAELLARTALQPTQGQTLSLRVIEAGQRPKLQLISDPNPTQTPQSRALRSALPRQVPLPQLLATLTQIGTPPAGNITPEVREAIRRLVAGLPSGEDLRSPEGVRPALDSAGLFLEAHLARGEVPTGELKLNLLRLLLRLRQHQNPTAERISGPAGPGGEASPPALLTRLLTQTEGALAGIQINQLTSLANDQAGLLWQLDLPIRNEQGIDVFELRVEREPIRDRDSEESSWTLTLRFDLDGLGPMQVKLRLKGTAVDGDFWARQERTLARIERHRSDLEQAFERAGLTLGGLRVHTGLPPRPPLPLPDQPLVDEKV